MHKFHNFGSNVAQSPQESGNSLQQRQVLRRIENRQSHAISNLKLRKTLFDNYNQTRKAWSNVRTSQIQRNINLFNESQLKEADELDNAKEANPFKVKKEESKELKKFRELPQISHKEKQPSNISMNADLDQDLQSKKQKLSPINRENQKSMQKTFLCDYNTTQGQGTFQTPLGANNILPYLNKKDVINLRKQEQEIKLIQKKLIDRAAHSSPKRVRQKQVQSMGKSKEQSPDSRERPNSGGIKEYIKKSTKHASNPRIRSKPFESTKRNGGRINQQSQDYLNQEESKGKEIESEVQTDRFKGGQGVNSSGLKSNKSNISVKKSKKMLSKNELRMHYDQLNQDLKNKLMDQQNYKVFYWAPDYSFCGFATSEQVRTTARKWMVDKKLKISHRDKDRSQEKIIQNVSSIPEIMGLLQHTSLE